MSSLRSIHVLPFNRAFVVHLAGQISVGLGQRGRLLVTYSFLTAAGLRVKNRQVGLGGEIDTPVGNLASLGEPLRWFGDYLLVECKDQQERVSEKEFGHFLSKLNLTKTKQSAIVSRGGLGFASSTQIRRA